MPQSIATSRVIIQRLPQQLPPLFLAPLLIPSLRVSHQISNFSTAANLCARHKAYRKRRDGNPNRGVSALRRTGLRYPVGMSKEPLPQPVLDPKRRSKVQGDPNHGLWGFFNSEKVALTTPKEDRAHGTTNPRRLTSQLKLILIQAEPGLQKNSDTNRGRICTHSGTYAVKSTTVWPQSVVNACAYVYVLEMMKPRSEQWWCVPSD